MIQLFIVANIKSLNHLDDPYTWLIPIESFGTETLLYIRGLQWNMKE
jgi:hypothetical protein